MNHLQTLINESIESSNSVDHLIAVSKKTSAKILSKLTNVQPTKQPYATIYGLKITEKGDIFSSHAISVTEDKAEYQNKEYKKGSYFKINDIVYTTLIDIKEQVTDPMDLVLSGKLRIVVQAPTIPVVQQSKFTIGRWRTAVGSRLIKLDTSVELLTDLDRGGIDSISLVDEVIATTVSEAVNTDIICSLITIAKKDETTILVNDLTPYYKGRELIIKLGLMASIIKKGTTAIPNFVLCTPSVEAILRASGQVTNNFIDGINLEIVCDTKTSVDYMLVGCAGGSPMEPSSLYYAPFVIPDILGSDADDGIELLFNRETNSLSPSYGTLIRYAIVPCGLAESNKVISIDWDDYANKSQFTTLCKVIV